MATLTPRDLKNIESFTVQAWSAHHRPEEVWRWVVARHCSFKCAWLVSLATLFGFLTMLARIID